MSHKGKPPQFQIRLPWKSRTPADRHTLTKEAHARSTSPWARFIK